MTTCGRISDGFDFQSAGARLNHEHGSVRRAHHQMQRDVNREATVRLARFEESVRFLAFVCFYRSYLHLYLLLSD